MNHQFESGKNSEHMSKKRRTRQRLDPSMYLRSIYVEKSCGDDPYVAEIVERAGLGSTLISEKDMRSLLDGEYPATLNEGKKTLLLCRNYGEFLKDCPGTRGYRCCDYRVINVGLGCPMDCVYCILQAYLNNPYLSFFINVEDLFAELRKKLDRFDGRVMRIGTGEFTDSMALDRITGMSRRLVEFFGKQKKGVLELKTKSAYVDNLEGLKHGNRTIVAWSLNSEYIVRSQEIRAASIDQRLQAASQCLEWGYDCAFHFDPIIAYPGWEDGYHEVVSTLFEKIPADRIRWISLGAFRYLPALKKIAAERFPQSQIFHHEFIEGMDDKIRYFRFLRVKLYKKIYHEIRNRCDPRTCIYFCMESDEVWRDVMGYTPEEKGGIPAMLDRTVLRR
jgi:spore photoproduct lyase